MPINNRRGPYDKFDPQKLTTGEWAVVTSGDPHSADGKSVYMCFSAGDVKRMATYEDMVQNVREASGEAIDAQMSEKIDGALREMTNATGKAIEAGNTANNAAENANQKVLEAREAITNLNVALKESQKTIEETNAAKQSALDAACRVEEVLGTGIADLIYPVGSIYMSVNNINPSTYFSGTQWVLWGSGRVPVGVDASQEEFNAAEKTGGEKTHVLIESELPSHSHSIPKLTGTAAEAGEHTHKTYYRNDNLLGNDSDRIGTKNANSGTRDAMEASGKHTHTISTNASNTGKAGTGAAHNNMPPYITCYMFKRIA